MKIPMRDILTGAPVGEMEIPDDVVAAAHLVQDWLYRQAAPATLFGLCLAEQVGQVAVQRRLGVES